MKSSSVSKCCKASISVAGSDEGTMFFVCDTCRKSCDPQSNKPKYGKDFFYGKIKSPPFNLERFKETAKKAKEIFDKCTCQPENNLVEKLCAVHNPGSNKEELNKLIAEAEQRGYERGKCEPK